MKIIALNGSHRKGKNTALMLNTVLEEAKSCGAEGELLEITDFNIKPCKGCNKCLSKPECSITDDDMAFLAQKMLDADGIVIGSPVYFNNVTGLLKIFMDRTRWMHMCENLLEGKVGAAVVVSGLRNGGQETTLQIINRFLTSHELHVVGCRLPRESVTNGGAIGTLYRTVSDNVIKWQKSVLDDPLTVLTCRRLGRNLVEKIKKLKG